MDPERFNTLSHLLGAIAAGLGLIVLVAVASHQGDPRKLISFSIYGLTLIAVYLSSTLYHGSQGRFREICRKLDHLAIYLLIAGTYTPFTLVTLRGSWGWSIFGCVWGLAVLGMTLEMLPQDQRRIVPMVIYLVMGWMILVALDPLLTTLPPGGFAWLLAGGLFYTAGIVFYALDWKVRYFHNLWHMCVLAGSVSHYFAVLWYVA